MSTLVGACSNNYVSTNLDKENINQYFSAAKVKIYQDEQSLPKKHQYLSLVEGEDCQVAQHHARPDEINARTQARQQAFNKNANAVIFTGCATLDHQQLQKLKQSNDTKECHAIIICYAKAFIVENETPE
jgi:RcsF protein